MNSYLFENHPDMMWIFDPEKLNILDANSIAIGFFGYSRQELLSMSIADLRPPEDVPALRKALGCIGSGFAQGGRWRLRRKAGDFVPVDIRWHGIDHQGKRAVLASIRDISDLVALEEERETLLESERQARRVADSRRREQESHLRTAHRLLGLGTWALNLDTGAVQWSESIYDLCGVDPDRFTPNFERFAELVHPNDREKVQEEFRKFQESTDSVVEFEHRIVRPDGRIVNVVGVGEITDTPEGRIMSGAIRDATQEKAAEAELAKANALVRIAGQSARLGGWRVDLETLTVTWSAETAAIHEVTVAETPDFDNAIAFYAPEYQDRIIDVYTACAERGVAYDEVLQIITATGRRVWVRSIGEPEFGPDGKIIAVQGAFQDISELVAAQQRTAGLAQRLLQTLESMSDAVFMLDSDWRFTFLNTQAETLLERRRDELLGRVVWDEFSDAGALPFKVQYEKAVATRQTVRFAEYFPPLGKWFEVSAYPSPEGLAVYFRDVTEARQRDEQLRLLETAVARQNDLLVIIDVRQNDSESPPQVVYVNDAFTERMGYGRDEVMGMTPEAFKGPETQHGELDRIRAAMESHQAVRAEVLKYTKTGEALWLDVDLSPIADERGQYTHYVAVERDITERKRAEETAKINEERFRLITKATSDIIWDWNFQAGSFWWGEGLSDLLGHDPAALAPGPDAWFDRIHDEDRTHVRQAVDQAIESGAATFETEYRFVHADGYYLTIASRGFVIRDSSGAAVRIIGNMTDVTERRRIDDRLRQSQKLEAIGQLTGGVAHDFNNLLTVILGNAELLAERLANDSSLRNMAEMTATAAERGADLTNRLLAFARRQALQPQRIDVNRTVSGMDGLLRRTLSAEINLEIVRAGGLWTAEVDAGQLEVALLNLALNARDAMPNGGCLTIETANTVLDEPYAEAHPEVTAGQYVMVSVSDTGMGMDPGVMAQAIEPFFTTKDVGKGSGLGLSMIFGFVKQSNGHMKIYSELGEGTTVKLYFPRVHSPVDDGVAKPANTNLVGGHEHILVVEDDDLVHDHLIERLKGLGYRVTGAHSGAEALKILRQTPDIDLLFTDVVMPGGMNGRELAEKARELYPRLRVLFTSGYTENAIVHHGRLDPGVNLLGKPYRYQELSAKIRKVLDEKSNG